jgi:hypothetical protein
MFRYTLFLSSVLSAYAVNASSGIT